MTNRKKARRVSLAMKRTGLVSLMAIWAIVGTSSATPTISDLKVTSVESLGVAIDFSVSGATEDDASLPLEISMTAGDATYYAGHLVGATNCVNGAHRVYWNMAQDGITVEPTTASLTVKFEYPLYCVLDFSGGSSAESCHVSYMATPPSGFNANEYKTTKLILKRVDAGSFKMQGSTTVTITKPFYMGLHEVTQRQWELVTGSNPCSSTSYGKGDAYPVHYVSYNDIRGSSSGAEWPSSNAVDSSSFLGKLRARTGLDFDLPTEAQWEYTCRAGTTTTYSYGDDANGAYMWYRSNASGASHVVGWWKLPNPWGFYDMHGNVYEWCLDWYGTLTYGADPRGSSSGSVRVLRGGSWSFDAHLCTSSYRGYSPSNSVGLNYGFRLSRVLPAEGSETAMVEFALGRICADGSAVDGRMSVGYEPTESRNAVVAINGETILNTSEAGVWTWLAPTAGTYTVAHMVGGDVMSVTYIVTNGYAKVEEEPNPPMELVEGVTLTPSGEIAAVAAGAKQIVKISGNGEEWTAATSADWLTLNSASGSATGKSIICTIAENTAAESRVGYVYVAGQTLKVSQAGRGSTVAESVVADTAGVEVAVSVSVLDETTTWSASSACPWILVETANGAGVGEVKLRVLPWNKTISRTGTVTVAGQTVTVTQAAASLAVSKTGATVVAQGETLSVDVETVKSVEWTITGVPEWATLDGDTERRGAGRVAFVVSPNTTVKGRSTTILIAGKAFTLTQDATKVEIEGELVRRCDDSGIDSLVVTVRVDVATASWVPEISEKADGVWVFWMSGEEPVTGDGTFDLYIASATEGDDLPRTATVTVGNATLRIVQGDGVVVEGVDTPLVIPTSWFEKYYSTQGGTTEAEWQKIAEGAGVKTDASGAALPVWHDYVAGTDPTDAESRFAAEVSFENGKPVVSWSPALNGEGVREGVRTYRVWGKERLTDAAWSEVAPTGESAYRFFRVSVEMP